MKSDDLREHIKLRDDADYDLRQTEKTRQDDKERTNEAKTAEKVNELIAANAATQAAMAAMAADNTSIKTLLTQLLQLQAKQNSTEATATVTETEHCTEHKTEPKTEPTTEPKTEPTTEPKTEQYTELTRMGVLQNSDSTVTHSYDLPVTALFTELENTNALNYTDFLQYSDSEQRRTVDPFSIYLYFKKTDQGNVIERIENLYTQKASSTAYKASSKTLLAELKNFSNPTQHTRIMVFMRALIFSSDPTTQQTTASILQAYFAAKNEDLQALQDHVFRHGAPPCIYDIDTIQGTPGLDRLSAVENPKYFEMCLRNIFDMVIECNSRICLQSQDTKAAEEEYRSTTPGENYAETKTNEERAWVQLCRAHGNQQPKTDYDRINFLLDLCAAYQGHTKTRRALLKALYSQGTTLTNAPFREAVPIIGKFAKFEDEINAQMGAAEDTRMEKKAAVNTAGAAHNQRERGTRMGAGGPEICNICAKPGHNARDCLQFMQREGTCGHWFMHSLGIYRTGCDFGSQCKKKHERPKGEPPENATVAVPVGTKRTAAMATGAVPITNGGKPKIQEMGLADISGKTFAVFMPSKATVWIKCNRMWLQPKDENDMVCQNCNTCHSLIETCEDGGTHSLQYHEMACELAATAVEADRTFKWVPYSVQVQMVEDDEAKCMTATVTRTRETRGVLFNRPATRAAAGCYGVSVSKMEKKNEDDGNSYLYDSD